jgi:uncharacterized protein YebE (UPF0316 family)
LPQLEPWVLIVLIFLARILDVSLGTMRAIVVFRGYALLAGVLGFFEVLVWLAAAVHVFRLDAWYLAFAYATGYATGNVVGAWLETRLAVGSELVRVVSEDPAVRLADRLRAEGYQVTQLNGHGAATPVEVLLIVLKRRHTPALLRRVRELDPTAIWTISDVRRDPTERRVLRPLVPRLHREPLPSQATPERLAVVGATSPFRAQQSMLPPDPASTASSRH